MSKEFRECSFCGEELPKDTEQTVCLAEYLALVEAEE